MDSSEGENHGEIGRMTGKEWLKSFSVSIAQLNQVTANVYSISPSNPNALKSRTSKSHKVDFGVPQAQPPLSNLHLQSCAWGSNTSIPDLIRQQSERQKSLQLKDRPESAKVCRQTRPPSARKPRPHSAKDAAHLDHAKPPKSSKFSYVKGAHCILTDRPPDGLKYHGNMGLVSPPDKSPESITYDRILDEIARVQNNDDHAPPAPCGSPNLLEIMEANQNQRDPQDCDDLEATEDSDSRSSKLGRGPAPLLRRPTAETIKLSLPQASLENDDVEEELLLSDTEGCHGNNSFDHDDELPSKDDAKLRNKSLDASNFGDTNAWASPKLNRTRNSKKGSRVTFSGVTFADVSDTQANNRPGSGRKDSRQLKTRSDSTSKLAGGDSENISTKVKAKIAVVSVAYIDNDEVSEGNNEPAGVYTTEKILSNKAYKKRKIFAQKNEIESQMSLLSLSDDEAKKTDASEGQEAKFTSQNSNQNYYELSKKNDGEDTTKSKTIKTLEFGESGIQETKIVERIDSPTQQSKPAYQAQRPMSGRPVSALKSGSKASISSTNLGEKRELFRRGTSHDSGVSQRPTSGQRHFNHKSFDDGKDQKESSNNSHTPGGLVAPEHFIVPVIKTPPVEERLFERRNHIIENGGSSQSEVKKIMLEKPDDMKGKLLRVASAPPMQRHQSIDYGKPRPKSAAEPNKDDLGAGQLSLLNMEKPSCHGNVPPRSRTAPSLKQRGKKEEPKKKVVELWTRRKDTEIETEGIKHCKQIQAKMVENGIPIALETLKRALLPPTEYATQPGYQTNTIDKRTLLPSYTSGLLSKPSTWFPAEYKRLLKAKRLVREAKAALDAQRREEERKERIMYLDPTAVPEPSPAPEEVSKNKKKKGRSRSASSQRSRPSSSRPNSGKHDR